MIHLEHALKAHEISGNLKELPEISTLDLVNYLILAHSFYTGEQLKAYKSLQAYKSVEALKFKTIERYYVVVGEVSFCNKLYLMKAISGCLEIKCPFVLKDGIKSISEFNEMKRTCFTKDSNRCSSLNKTHIFTIINYSCKCTSQI